MRKKNLDESLAMIGLRESAGGYCHRITNFNIIHINYFRSGLPSLKCLFIKLKKIFPYIDIIEFAHRLVGGGLNQITSLRILLETFLFIVFIFISL